MTSEEFSNQKLVKIYNRLTTEKSLSATEYFAVLRLAVSRAEGNYKILRASSYETLKYLMNGNHDRTYRQAIKIVKALEG